MSTNSFISTMVITTDGWLINGKYFVDNNGTIWYDRNYVGKRGDFPQWLFQLRKELLGK